VSQVLTDHNGSVNCIAVLPGIIATGGTDGTINIYTFNATYTHAQTLNISPLYPLTISFQATSDGYILAAGGSSPHIHLYISPLHSINFTSAAILKGHEDWIRGLTFSTTNTDIILASASQDRYVRLWRLTKSNTNNTKSNDIDALLTETLGGESYPFTLNGTDYAVTFSALLPGHDDWVFTVSFHPQNPNILLSASADASLILWRPEATSGIWIPETRLGEVSSLKGATTAQGSSGGFWGGLWSPDGTSVASWGKTGSWRVWHDDGEGLWVQRNAVGGCTRPVKGISWDPEGRFLLSVRYFFWVG
jgi:elongator complex protein 2